MLRRCQKQSGIVRFMDRMGRNSKILDSKSTKRKLKSWYQANKASYRDTKNQVNLRNPRIIP